MLKPVAKIKDELIQKQKSIKENETKLDSKIKVSTTSF
jgi:hypothetical protein